MVYVGQNSGKVGRVETHPTRLLAFLRSVAIKKKETLTMTQLRKMVALFVL